MTLARQNEVQQAQERICKMINMEMNFEMDQNIFKVMCGILNEPYSEEAAKKHRDDFQEKLVHIVDCPEGNAVVWKEEGT